MPPGSKPVVLITGASSGIGQACANHLHQRGYRVYGTSRRAQSPAAQGPDLPFTMIQMDVDSDDSVRRGVDLIVQQEGRLDVVVNNAGFGTAGAVEDTSIDEAKAQFETNFFGVLRVCRAVLPIMRAQRSGIIVNVGSIAGLIGAPFQGVYCASKFALEGLTEALSAEVRPLGIRVALIEPGDLRTAFTTHRRTTAQSATNPAYRERFSAALGVVEADEMSGPPPDRAARLLERIITRRSPRLRYVVGPPFEKVAALLKKVVPARLFERGLMKYYKLR
jgi:NAD(P)-dependent dehydrogenase (short-subunit alcohol dehydrogenase family)